MVTTHTGAFFIIEVYRLKKVPFSYIFSKLTIKTYIIYALQHSNKRKYSEGEGVPLFEKHDRKN